MKKFFLLFSLAFGVFLFACNQAQNKTSEAVNDSSETVIRPLQDSTATEKQYTETYEGTLPCTDCSGIETTLSLTHKEYYAEGTFDLKHKYIDAKGGANNVINESGKWTTDRGNDADPDATIIELYNDQDSASVYFLRIGKDIQKLDENMNEIKSNLNYTLKLVSSDSTLVPKQQDY